MSKKRILLIHTGGTISMAKDQQSGAVLPSQQNPMEEQSAQVGDYADLLIEAPFTLPSPHITPDQMLTIKQLIENNRKGNEHIAIDKIEEMRKIVSTSADISDSIEELNYLHISDSFVFVCTPKSVISLIELLATIQTRIINECNFLLRGAITIGDTIIREDGKFIIGPAYIQAFQLQEDDAIYPRIIADKSVIKQLTKQLNKSNESINKYLKQDSDKEYFVDYITVYMDRGELEKTDMTITLRRENIFSYLSSGFDKYYKDNNHNISQKYGWTMQYYKNLGVWEDG